MATLGTLEYLISVNSSQLNSGLSSAEGKVKGFGNKLSSWAVAKGQMISRLVEKAGMATVNAMKDAVQSSMGFDKAMSQYIATRGASLEDLRDETSAYSKELKQMSAFAQEMGKKGKYNATEVAKALNYMALAGYDAETSMKMMPNVLALAQAGDMDLARASDIVTDAQTALGLSLEETDDLVDQMAKTASITNTSVEQLGEAILTVGANARSIKGGTAEMNALLGQLASNGIKGSRGGTVLRNILNALSNPLGKAAKQLKTLGISAYDAATGELKPMVDLLPEISEALSGMDEAGQAAFFSQAFNVRDTAAVKALMDMSKSEWTDLKLQILASQGAAQDMADVQMDNLNGDITMFKNQLEDSKLEIMKGITPSLRTLVKKGTTWVKRLTEAFGNNGFAGVAEEAGKIIQEGVEYLKNSDSPVLQKLGSALEGVKKVGKFVYDLFTDFPGTIQNLKSSDNKILTILAEGLESLKTVIESIELAFTDGIPAAIEHLQQADDPLANLLGGGLQLLYDVCKFFVDNLTLEGTITAIAGAFALFKGIEITGSLITFISKLSSIKNASQLNQLLKGIQDGSLTGSGTGDTGTSVAAGATVAKTGIWSKIGAGVTAASSFGLTALTAFLPAVVAGVVSKLVPDEAKIGNKERVKAATYTKQDVDNLREYVELSNEQAKLNEEYFTTGETDEKRMEEVVNRLQELYELNVWDTDLGHKLHDYFVEKGESFEFGNISTEIFDELETAAGEDGIPVRINPQPPGNTPQKIKEEVGVVHLDADLTIGGISNMGKTIGGTPKGGGGSSTKYYIKSNAKGNWDVPYDNYLSLLHRNEMVLTASQARQYRDGQTGSTSAMVGAVQSLKNDLQGLKIVVGKRTFGRTVVDYGGDRVNNYIGKSEGRTAAGYGT